MASRTLAADRTHPSQVRKLVSKTRLPVLPEPHGPRPRPQFGLRALFYLTAGVGLALTAGVTLGPLWSAVTAWVGLLIFVHVAANAWGTRTAARRLRGLAELQDDQRPPLPPAGAVAPCAPGTRLAGDIGLGRWLGPSTLLAGLFGMLAGVGYLLLVAPSLPHWPGIVVGLLAMGVMGGLFGFLVASFAHVLLIAVREAAGHAPPTKSAASSASLPPSSYVAEFSPGRALPAGDPRPAVEAE